MIFCYFYNITLDVEILKMVDLTIIQRFTKIRTNQTPRKDRKCMLYSAFLIKRNSKEEGI